MISIKINHLAGYVKMYFFLVLKFNKAQLGNLLILSTEKNYLKHFLKTLRIMFQKNKKTNY